ncbi:MAG: stage V sporulation protein T [Clostridia bacterium]|nr:stage V sporulation protein T [Clostridia bacterium]
MKATGIVRRIDDLGRVVIPKEIRRTMRIREGDPLEIFTNKDGEVIFKKYSPIGELGDFASSYAETLAKTSGNGVLITDKDNVIAVSGIPKKELSERRISPDLERIMSEKSVFIMTPQSEDALPVVEGVDKYFASVAAPIIAEGDSIGTVVMISTTSSVPGEVEKKLTESAAGFLGRHMES